MEIMLIIVLSVIVWSILNCFLSKQGWKVRIWKVLNWGMFMGTLSIVLYITFLSRSVSEEHEFCIIPFYSFYLAKENVEWYRTMTMNVFLFVPLGLSMPTVFLNRTNVKISRVVWMILALTIGIEILQFVFCLGRAEIDDVLCNLAGGLIGISSYAVAKRVKKNTDEVQA